jgi:hypothetical protein
MSMPEIPNRFAEVVNSRPFALWGEAVVEGVFEWLYSKECQRVIHAVACDCLRGTRYDPRSNGTNSYGGDAWGEYVLKRLVRWETRADRDQGLAAPEEGEERTFRPADFLPTPSLPGETEWIEANLQRWFNLANQPEGTPPAETLSRKRARSHLERWDPSRKTPFFIYVVFRRNEIWGSFENYCLHLRRQEYARNTVGSSGQNADDEPVGKFVPEEGQTSSGEEFSFFDVYVLSQCHDPASPAEFIVPDEIKQALPIARQVFEAATEDTKRKLRAGSRVKTVLASVALSLEVSTYGIFYKAWASYLAEVQGDPVLEGSLRTLWNRCKMQMALDEKGCALHPKYWDGLLWMAVEEKPY